MKLVITLLLMASYSFAQETTFNLTVLNERGGPDAGRDVVFVESNTYDRMLYKTDATGKLSIVFDHGTHWVGSVGSMKNCLEVHNDYSGSSSRMLMYNPERYARETAPRPDRRTINFDVIEQSTKNASARPPQGMSIMEVMLKDDKGKTYSGVPVNITSYDAAKMYISKTNSSGIASFVVPNGISFDVDVDGVESLTFGDIPDRSGTQRVTLLYQPRTFTEKTEDGLTVQALPTDVEPSSSHTRVKLKIMKHRQVAVNEDVYVRMIKSNTVYHAKTDENGETTLMLPIRQKYLVDFNLQHDAEQIDLSRMKGISKSERTINYTPDPKIEHIEDFLPRAQSLIAYDLQNFVDRQYPEPVEGNVDFYLKWGNKFNETSKEALLEIGFKIKSKPERKVKVPLNICFVIDKSGSMSGEDRIEKLKSSLISFIDQLNPDDRVSIVVFDSEAKLALPVTLLNDKRKVRDIINVIYAGGGTSIYKGLMLGFETLQKSMKPDHVNRVILLTDGYGSTPPETVINDAKKYIAQGMELSAIGVGVGYNEALLAQLASAGGGLMHFAGSTPDIEKSFAEELNSIVYPMAKKAILTVRYNDQIVYRQLYGYSNEKVTKGQMNVDIPHLFPGLNQMALIKFDLIHATPEIEKEKVTVTLEYQDLLNDKKITLNKSISPEWTEATGELDMTIDKEHKKLLAVANTNQLLKIMANQAEAKDYAAAEQTTKDALKQFTDLFPNAQPEEILSLTNRLNEYLMLFNLIKKYDKYK